MKHPMRFADNMIFHNHRVRNCACLIVLVLIGAGCGKTASQTESGPPVARIPSQADAEKFARQFEADLKNKPASQIHLLDWDRLYAHCTKGVEIPENERAAAKRGFIGGAKSQGMIAQIQQNIKSGGSYTFLRARNVDGDMQALFRMIGKDNSINYHALDLVKADNGRIVAEDIFIYATGEKISETMRRVIVQIATQQNRGFLARLKGSDKSFIESLPKIQRMQQAMTTNRPQEVLSIYRSLPEDVQKFKYVMMVRMLAASKSPQNMEYLTAMEEFRARFPNDPSMLLMSIDYYLLKNQFDQTIKTIDKLDKNVGGDPHLDQLRLAVYRQAGNVSKAQEVERRINAAGAKR